ncbi:putative short-chain dehydrogenase [Pseudovirgaria hyperparasitica]|uniref:Putative short-chain dehydrogenase n=1 Tax=Pseudovirgaria hyperparasitica TaxID=470096 RepID=A0A6A6WAQ6_9PEZI|nr:putative short-chain dehydrogenase [Pseudovirgaria hyperparasitica]KAF2759259.1 putative short-chain dehydrogenase [Pseudovirgaria hyperparasitica]
MSKNYLITGACRGIGRGLSRLLLEKGHRVFLLDNAEPEIEHMRAQLPKWLSSKPTIKDQYHVFRGDLSNRSDIDRAASSASAFFAGHVDVLINNAANTTGVIHEHRIDSPEFPELWAKTIAVNLTGSMLLTRAVLPQLRKTSTREHGGSVIFMSSTRAYQSEPNSEAYAATKAGLLGLSQALSCSLADDGIRVNAILPGWINVQNESRWGDEKGMSWEDGLTEEDHRWHFAGRVGKVEDVFRAVEYLGDGNSWVTGQECVVDGGVTRRMVYPE